MTFQENPHLLTNFPRGDKYRLAGVELFLEYCSYAGFDAYAAESTNDWPGQGGLYTRVRCYRSEAWIWAAQVPQDLNDPFYGTGRSYV